MRPFLTACFATCVVFTAAAFALLVSVLTLFHARRFVADVIIRRSCQMILAAGGVDVVVHGDRSWPTTQTVYVFNHTSSLDLFVVCALGLPNVRFFLKRKFLLFVPMGLLSALAGTFFTAPQTQPAARTRLFEKATRVLRSTGESVFLSPEGTRVTSGEIGAFNKGAFHLAAALGAPIVPLYFHTPAQSDPGKGLLVGSGTVHVHVLPPVSTSSWQIERVADYRDQMHLTFTSTHARLRAA
ncbi:MAG: lysophospholipid acyltransferase family protein [Deltaproteobacteria bacterium]|nr:lysophospholipid acyltransferase family protein [Deltaproteobacteria bacterium]